MYVWLLAALLCAGVAGGWQAAAGCRPDVIPGLKQAQLHSASAHLSGIRHAPTAAQTCLQFAWAAPELLLGARCTEKVDVSCRTNAPVDTASHAACSAVAPLPCRLDLKLRCST